MLRRIWDSHYSSATRSIHPKAFANDADEPDRHSVSREIYTSASTLQSLAPEPERFGVVAVAVLDYNEMDQVVEHDPIDEDFGHCNAIGSKTSRVKEYLRKHAIVRIAPPPPRQPGPVQPPV